MLCAGCRVTVEHAFGWLKRRFPIIAVPHQQTIEMRVATVWMCAALHKFLIQCGDTVYNRRGEAHHNNQQAQARYEEWIERGEFNTESSDSEYHFQAAGRPSLNDVAAMAGADLASELLCKLLTPT